MRKYRADYNINPPDAISFMPAIASTSGRIHSEFVRLLFLQGHRETDRFFSPSGVQFAQSNSGLFHYHRAAFSSQLKSKCGNILAKPVSLRIILNIEGVPVVSRSHSPITLANLSCINLFSIFRCSSPTRNPVYVRIYIKQKSSFIKQNDTYKDVVNIVDKDVVHIFVCIIFVQLMGVHV